MREATAEIEVLGDLDAGRGMPVAALAPDGALVHVSEEAAKASADLLCPACRTGVIAVKGPVRAHHFRHRSRADCLAGAETALHLLAKRALEARPEMVLPRIRLETDRTSRVFRSPRLVRLERREAAVRPDVCCVVEGAPLYVEIRASHRVDEAKRPRRLHRRDRPGAAEPRRGGRLPLCRNISTFAANEAMMNRTTISSRDFNQDAGRAKRAAAAGPVFITDRGRPAHVLLTIEEYRRLVGEGRSVAELLAMPGAAEVEFDPPRLPDMAAPAELS